MTTTRIENVFTPVYGQEVTWWRIGVESKQGWVPGIYLGPTKRDGDIAYHVEGVNNRIMRLHPTRVKPVDYDGPPPPKQGKWGW